MAVQHREQHREAVLLEAHGEPPRIGRVRRVDQRLDLDQQRPRALERREHARAGDGTRVLREKERRGIAHAAQAFFGHGEDAELVHRAKAVLHRAHQAKGGVGIALEVEHRVDDVLEHARAGDRAFLRDMPDEEQGGT